MSQALFRKVRRFVHEFTQKPLADITPKTSLFCDLNLDMSNAPCFFERFGSEFGIDVNGVDLRPYFEPGEFQNPGWLVTLLWVFWYSTLDAHRFNGIKPLLVEDLVKMAREKRWCAE